MNIWEEKKYNVYHVDTVLWQFEVYVTCKMRMKPHQENSSKHIEGNVSFPPGNLYWLKFLIFSKAETQDAYVELTCEIHMEELPPAAEWTTGLVTNMWWFSVMTVINKEGKDWSLYSVQPSNQLNVTAQLQTVYDCTIYN